VWLAALAEAHAWGRFPELWTAQEVADHLGVTRKHVLKLLQREGVTAVAFADDGARLFDRLDVEDLQARRAHEREHSAARSRRRRQAWQRERNVTSKAQRLASRVLIDGRLVAVKAKTHGSATTYSNGGCRCEPCTEANIVAGRTYYRQRSARARARST
jgi:DNA-binding transcriptional regulator LsrR (DeoR family)